MTAPLRCADLCVAPGDSELIRDLNLECHRGEILAVLGINGAGKTSLLETLCGLRAPHRGRVLIDGTDLANVPRRTVAQRVGLMTQRVEDSFPQQALPLVAIGRYAQHSFWQWQDAQDLSIARTALERVGLGAFAQRWTESLSGGERQRLALAMLLAQAPRVMLLDEPFSQLDPYHQQDVMRLLRALRTDGQSVVMSVHDMNLAAHCADRVLLLFGDGQTLLGETDSVLTAANLSRLYGTQIRALDGGEAPHFSFFS